MPKRKAEHNAVDKYAHTPKKNVAQTDYSVEFAAGENVMKGNNRNSKHGQQGKSHE